MLGILDKPVEVGPATGVLALFFPPKEEDVELENIDDDIIDFDNIRADMINLDTL
jgi:hypothetical protein